MINLETSVTRSADFAPGKAICYRMSPGNLPAVTAAHPDACALANNHVLDFGHTGLTDTLGALARVGLPAVGAGRDLAQARQPVTIPLRGGRAVSSPAGPPPAESRPAGPRPPGRPGVDLLPGLSGAAAEDLIARMQATRQPGDIVLVSLHWGSNWGYGVADDQVRFAHRLIDAGADLIHGHSSHHPRPVEVYRGRLVLYGCGDAINDHEGIGGYEEFRPDLRLLYYASVAADTSALAALRMVPMQASRCGYAAPPLRTPGGCGRYSNGSATGSGPRSPFGPMAPLSCTPQPVTTHADRHAICMHSWDHQRPLLPMSGYRLGIMRA